MKYFFICLLALPVLASCTVVQEQYDEQDYYAPAPRVEVRPYQQNDYYREQRHYHRHTGYRPVVRGRVYHGHGNPQGNTVIVTPRGPRAQVEVQPNVHGHAHSNRNMIITHPGTPATIHGHNQNIQGIRKQPVTGAEAQSAQNTHRP